MRRFLLVGTLFACLWAPSPVAARGWHGYTNRTLGFALRYPSGWQIVSRAQLGEQLVSLTFEGRYTIQISVLRVAPGRTVRQMVRRVLRYEAHRGITAYRRLRWKRTRLGGRMAALAVVGQDTEVGTALSQAFVLAPGRRRTYQIMIPINGKRPLHSLARFPPIYLQILSTWRFL